MRWLVGGLILLAVDLPWARGGGEWSSADVTRASASPSAGRRHRRRRHKVKKPHRPVSGAVTAPAPAPKSTGPTRLVIPVQGVKPEQLVDTYGAARSGGRLHDAIDIHAPRNTPVVAAIDGKVIKLFHSERGGVTINQLGDDGGTVYYYAHLDHYADGMVEGRRLAQGEVIGYVGDSGNAGPGNYHLHFAIWRIQDIQRYWEGENMNPYPLLRAP